MNTQGVIQGIKIALVVLTGAYRTIIIVQNLRKANRQKK